MTDDDRFDAVFRATYARVLAYGRRRAAEATAQDVAAETYAVAWRRRHQLPADELALPWLLAIARRTLANHSRGERHRLRLRARLAAQPHVPATVAPDAPGGVVHAGLAQLSDADRELLRLAYWDDLSPAEIAEVVGASVNAVNVRLHRARRRLRGALDAHADRPDLEASHAC
jgi:RNA polymerase sigma-70 factor, ECF subfamily